MTDDEDRIAALEAELVALCSKAQEASKAVEPALSKPAVDEDGVVRNVKISVETGTAAKWRPAKKRKVDPERLIWGTSRRRWPRICS